MDPPTNLYEFPYWSSCYPTDPTDSYQNTTDLHSMEFIRIPILNHTDLHTNPHTDLATVRRSRSLPISLYRSRCAVCWSRRYGRSQWTDRIEGMPECSSQSVSECVCSNGRCGSAPCTHRSKAFRKCRVPSVYRIIRFVYQACTVCVRANRGA